LYDDDRLDAFAPDGLADGHEPAAFVQHGPGAVSDDTQTEPLDYSAVTKCPGQLVGGHGTGHIPD
jgi:hypothetical protein